MRVAEPSKGDKTALSDPDYTPAQKQAALLTIDDGTDRADKSWDELLRIATRVIMSPLNIDLGLEEYVVSDRVFKNWRKDEPVDHGNLIVLTGSATISAVVTEIMDGDTPVEGADPILENKLPFTTPTDPDGASPIEDSPNVTPANLQVDIENP